MFCRFFLSSCKSQAGAREDLLNLILTAPLSSGRVCTGFPSAVGVRPGHPGRLPGSVTAHVTFWGIAKHLASGGLTGAHARLPDPNPPLPTQPQRHPALKPARPRQQSWGRTVPAPRPAGVDESAASCSQPRVLRLRASGRHPCQVQGGGRLARSR